MFEKFGLRDAFCGIWKYKYWILIGVFLCILLVVGKDIRESGKQTEVITYKMDKQIRFNPVRAPQDSQSVLNSQEYTGGQVALSYITLFETQAFKEYVVNYVQTTGQEVSTSEVGNSISAMLMKDNYILSITVTSARKEVVEPIMQACYSYMVVSHKILYEMDESTIKQVGQSDIITTVTKNSVDYVKDVIVGMLGGIFISCVVVFFIVLFRPVLNRKNDFRTYGISVIAEIYLHGKKNNEAEIVKSILLQLEHLCEKKEWKQIGFTTSSEKGNYPKQIIKQLCSIENVQLNLVELSTVCLQGTLLEQCQKCDAVVLVERYGYSLYEEYENAIEFLQKNDIEIAGVIACK